MGENHSENFLYSGREPHQDEIAITLGADAKYAAQLAQSFKDDAVASSMPPSSSMAPPPPLGGAAPEEAPAAKAEDSSVKKEETTTDPPKKKARTPKPQAITVGHLQVLNFAVGTPGSHSNSLA